MTGVRFGIDVGTTSVAGVAVDAAHRVIASAAHAHAADVPAAGEGVCEQDPERLFAAVETVLRGLRAQAGAEDAIGWTGQMHGVVGVGTDLKPVTPFVTWRDRRLYGGRMMRGWAGEGRVIFKCLSVCGYAIARLTGRCVIDPTFLHAWYLDELSPEVRSRIGAWLPPCVEGSMLGDNQAGVFAAQAIAPGAAVVNIGTSAQLSVVLDEPFTGPCLPGAAAANGLRTERRPYPGGRTLLCRAGIAGGRAWADLRERLGIGWDGMNDSDDPRVAACAADIVGELVADVDLSGIRSVVGVGNALRLNARLRREVETRFGVPCVLPDIGEMAAWGAAHFAFANPIGI